MGKSRSRKPDERREAGWVGKPTLVRVLDISDRSFERYLSPHLPDDARRGNGRSLEFYGRAVMEVWARRMYAPTQSIVPVGGDTDDMMVEGDNTALERYRNARADLSELDLAERRGVVVHFDRFWGHLTRAFRLIRSAGESLQRKFGNEAADILNE